MSVAVKNLTKLYGPQKAIDNISFEVKSGEVVGFLGPNGAGKTTTMKIITCFIAPAAGDVEVGGLSIHSHPDEVRQMIGYLPESNPLYTEMPVVDYLEFVGRIQGVPQKQIAGRIREMIDYCGLGIEKHKKIGELSKGYRQRVGLAQAMIHNPDVLILDEPTTGLDPNQIVEIRNLIKNLATNKTIILSTHILQEVEQTCDRILIINKGKIVADDTAKDLRSRREGSEILTVQIEAIPGDDVAGALAGIPGVESAIAISQKPGFYRVQSNPNEKSRKGVFSLCAERKWFLLEMTGKETSLEDVFRELTTDTANE